jgi:hypothetical protein
LIEDRLAARFLIPEDLFSLLQTKNKRIKIFWEDKNRPSDVSFTNVLILLSESKN